MHIGDHAWKDFEMDWMAVEFLDQGFLLSTPYTTVYNTQEVQFKQFLDAMHGGFADRNGDKIPFIGSIGFQIPEHIQPKGNGLL